jgi:hypothetical protein
MSVMTDTYIEELANGWVPRQESAESRAWREDSVRDYSWALSKWAEIRESVRVDFGSTKGI